MKHQQTNVIIPPLFPHQTQTQKEFEIYLSGFAILFHFQPLRDRFTDLTKGTV